MITFKIEKDREEFHTWAPELPGGHSHGKTVIELYPDVVMEEEITLQY